MDSNAGYTQMGSHPVAGRARAMRGCDSWTAKPAHLDFIAVPDTTTGTRRLRDSS
jgi:hypothetical protein